MQIDRVIPFEQREDLGINRLILDVSLDSVLFHKNIFPLFDGDLISIHSISDMRKNVVTISGAITRPGDYQLDKKMSVSDLIEKADGLIEDTYLGRVDVNRLDEDFNRKLIRLDLRRVMDFNPNENIELFPGDKIELFSIKEMKPKPSVRIEGHVKKPGDYLLKKGMRIKDALFYSGWFLDENFKNETYLKRADLISLNSDKATKSIYNFDLSKILKEDQPSLNKELKNGDIIKIYPKNYFNDKKFVRVNGIISNPGKYELKTKMDLKDLILEAGGFKEFSYKYKVEISRMNFIQEYDIFSSIFEVFIDDGMNILSDSSNIMDINTGKLYLDAFDEINILAETIYNVPKKIVIQGAVKFPGNYTISSDDEQISDILFRAGGFKKDAYPLGSEFKRNKKKLKVDFNKINDRPGSKFDFNVQEGDTIFISTQPRVIGVIGEVNSEGWFKYETNLKIKDVIKRSGGFTSMADKKSVYIKYPNGISKYYSPLFSNHKVLDGSIVYVGKKKETEPFNLTTYLTDATQILASLVQVVSFYMLIK